MKYSKFLENKITRQIQNNGTLFTFNKVEKDEFGQNQKTDETVTVKGIFHEGTTFMSSTASDSAILVKFPQTKILMLFEDSEKIEKGFTVEYSGKIYKVSAKQNFNGLNIAVDCSLEVECEL